MHYRSLAPQFRRFDRLQGAWNTFVGLALFSIGLFKKTAIADTLAVHAATYHSQATLFDPGAPQSLTLVTAWIGSLCVGAGGTFDGSTLVTKVDAALDPARMGTEQVRKVRFEGERMILTPPPLEVNGVKVTRELTWEKISPISL